MFGLLTLFACSSSDEKANKLFVEASNSIKQAREAENSSYVQAYQLYKKAFVNIERITSKYPSSNMAVQIAQGQLLLDLYRVSDFRTTVLEKAQARAEAEEDPLFCGAEMMISVIVTFNYSSTIKILKESGEKEKAERLLSRFLKHAQTMKVKNELSRTFALKDLAISYQIIGDKEKSKLILIDLFENSAKLRNEFCWTKIRTESLCKGLDAIERDAHLSVVGEGFAEIGEYDKAEEVAGKITGEDYRAEVYVAIGAVYAESGQSEKALAMVKKAESEMKSPKTKVSDSLRIKIGIVYAKAGAKNKADEILSEVLKTAMKSKKSYKLGNVLVAYLEAGFYDKVVQLAEKERLTYLPYLLFRVAAGYAKSGQFEKSLKISERNPEIKCAVSVIVAGEYAKAGQKEKAITLLNSSLNQARKEEKIYILASIAGLYGQLGEKKRAAELLSEATESLKGLDTRDKAELLSEATESLKDKMVLRKVRLFLADRYIELNDVKMASELMSQYLQFSKSLNKMVLRKVYLFLVDRYIELNDVKTASKLMSQYLQFSKSLKGWELVDSLISAGVHTKGKIRVNDADRKILHDLLRDSIKQS
ncbi:MAG: hypothetical protein NTU69_11195 [Proteobacteria bacterium]|nr:hypothetical protein [Pseudomonadota bacterium]